MRFVGHVMRRGKIEDLSLTGRIPGYRAKEIYGWNNKNSRKWK